MNRYDIEKIHFKGVPLVGSGSYFICGVTDTDIDYFTLDQPDTRRLLNNLGFTGHADEVPDEYCDGMGECLSYRKDCYNIILVQTRQELERIQFATDVCRKLQLTSRDDRLVVFDAIRRNIGPYDNDLTEFINCEIPRI